MATELVLEPSIWLLLCAVAFSAGFIDAIAGGGGLLTVPALLTAGLPPHVVLGTNKLAATFGSFTASLTYYRKRLFNPRYWRRSLIFTAIGAILGTLLVDMISKEALEKILPLLILLSVLSGLAMLVPAIYASVINQDAIARNFLYAALLVLIVTGMIALATSANRRRPRSRDTLLSMLCSLCLSMLISTRARQGPLTLYNIYKRCL